MKIVIIDGYNELFKHQSGENLEQKRLSYIQDICHRYQSFSGRVFLVFDGKYGNKSHKKPQKNIFLYFSSNPQEADDYICDLIQKHHKNELEIITRDEKIKRFAKTYSCKTRSHSSHSTKKQKRTKNITPSLEDHENQLFRLALKMRDDNSSE